MNETLDDPELKIKHGHVCRRCSQLCGEVSELHPFCNHCTEWMLMSVTDATGHNYSFDDKPTFGERLRWGFHTLHGDSDA